MRPINIRYSALFVIGFQYAAAVFGCGHTRTATHVEILDEGGDNTYVSGAAGSGLNQSLACRQAVTRAVDALADRFTRENSGVGKAVSSEMGLNEGAPLLHRYARVEALSAAIQDVHYDPLEHLCLATVRWRPPVFIKDAVLAFANEVRRQELAAESEPAMTGARPGVAATTTVPEAPVPTPSAPQAPAACSGERRVLDVTRAASREPQSRFDECLRRTNNDEQVCYRYKTYADQARKKEQDATVALDACLRKSSN